MREWLEDRFGTLEVVRENVGGMSPGCATSFRTSSAQLFFVKAVGSALNDHTPSLFRHELHIRERLRRVTTGPSLLPRSTMATGWLRYFTRSRDGWRSSLRMATLRRSPRCSNGRRSN